MKLCGLHIHLGGGAAALILGTFGMWSKNHLSLRKLLFSAPPPCHYDEYSDIFSLFGGGGAAALILGIFGMWSKNRVEYSGME